MMTLEFVPKLWQRAIIINHPVLPDCLLRYSWHQFRLITPSHNFGISQVRRSKHWSSMSKSLWLWKVRKVSFPRCARKYKAYLEILTKSNQTK